ncbi:MAG: hypothetical protein KDI71_06740 [Xanthomonadales bacterium]|nr:hypothetical protein [Xanthomonadales bacterium]
MTGSQQPLALSWRDGGHFDDYFPEQSNAAAVALLRQALNAGDCSICLRGGRGTGRTHLCLAAAEAIGDGASYLSLKRPREDANALLQQQPAVDLLCLDDADLMLGDPASEKALFDLHNRIRDHRGCLIITENSDHPAQINLPDLRSRWRGATQIQLLPLSDQELASAWTRRARLRGLLPDAAVIQWMLTHRSRNFADWMQTLEQLDSAALALGRRLTLPFVREQLTSK